MVCVLHGGGYGTEVLVERVFAAVATVPRKYAFVGTGDRYLPSSALRLEHPIHRPSIALVDRDLGAANVTLRVVESVPGSLRVALVGQRSRQMSGVYCV